MTLCVRQGHSSTASFSMLTSTSYGPAAIAVLVFSFYILSFFVTPSFASVPRLNRQFQIIAFLEG